MAMTNEEIDAEIKRLQALKEQNNQTQTTENNNPADGIYNPADYISQIINKMNEASYTDGQGNKKSYGRGDKFSKSLDVAKNAGKIGNRTEDQFGNPLPDTAYEYITQMFNSERAKGSVSDHTLRMIENEAKARYNVPSDFDISGKGWIGNTDAAMARAMNSIAYNGKAQQTQPAQTPKPVSAQDTQQATKTEDKPKGKQVANSNKGVAGASVGDFIVRSDGSTYVINQGDIDWAKKKTAPQTQQADIANGNVKDQMKTDIANGNVKDQMKTDIANGNGLNDDMQFMQRYSKAAGSRKPEDLAFLTSENAKRYSDLVHKQNEAKKASKNAKKIENLRQELEIHKKIMAENPDRPDIQKAQQTFVDSITKDIQKLGGSVE